MMVEAEATDGAWNLIQGGAPKPTEDVVAQGLEAAKPFLKQLCDAQQQVADAAAKPTQDFPLFLDYQQDAYDAVKAQAEADLGAGDHDRRQAGARGAPRRDQGRREGGRSPTASRVARRRSPRAFRSLTKKVVRQRILRDKVRMDGRGLADIRPCRPRSRSSRACTARRCSSAARPRSWASPR